MLRTTLLCCVCLVLAATNGSAQQQLVLSENGRARATIVLPDQPAAAEQKAAQELQAYFRQIGGVTIPIDTAQAEGINIYVGSSTDPELPTAAVTYSVQGQDVYLTGGSPTASLHAVYVFLEREFGCRFYSPVVERIPRRTNIELPPDLAYRYAPPITTRTVHSRLFYDHPDFAAKLRVTDEAFPRYVPAARVHTFHRFVPADQFYRAHPEYYALRNGQRLPTQLCLTNEAVFNIVRDSVAAHLARHPAATVISVSQDDNTQYCQCDRCAAIDRAEGSPAGSLIHFVNRIAEQFPDKQISTLAYQYTRRAPRTVRPLDNVLITLCSIECDRSAPIAEKCPDFSRDLEAWSAISDNIRIWDYTTQFTNFLAPFPNLHTLQPNIDLFVNNDARWVFEQHSHHPSELFELRSYLTAQLLWQPDAAPQAIVADFLAGYYEAAAPFVQSYIETVHAELQRDSSFFLFLYGDPSQGFESFLRDSLLTYYDGLYDVAAKAVAGQPEMLDRLNAARLSVDYAILEHARRNLREAATSPALRDRLARFAATTAQADITLMNEMGYTVAEYIADYRKTLERARQPNRAYGKPVTLQTRPKKYAAEDPQTLTDGAFGGGNFYANWLGFEGNDLEAIIDLGEPTTIRQVSAAFLQVTNHIVFFPTSVEYLYSVDGREYRPLGVVSNARPLTKESKVNDIQYYARSFAPVTARYIKVVGKNSGVAPVWHNAAGLPAWIFVDEVMVE